MRKMSLRKPRGTAKGRGRAHREFQYGKVSNPDGVPAVFIDRDGTLNRMVYDETHGVLDSPRRPEQVQLVPGAGEFLRNLKRAGFLTVIVTNQPAIAKGTLTLPELYAVNWQVAQLLEKKHARWDSLYFCPHHSKGVVRAYTKNCDCRKPKAGLLLQAAKHHGIDLRHSWMVGDGLNDVQAGRAAGCKTILVTNLKMEQVEQFFALPNSKPTAIAPTLREALNIILTASKYRQSKGVNHE